MEGGAPGESRWQELPDLLRDSSCQDDLGPGSSGRRVGPRQRGQPLQFPTLVAHVAAEATGCASNSWGRCGGPPRRSSAFLSRRWRERIKVRAPISLTAAW